MPEASNIQKSFLEGSQATKAKLLPNSALLVRFQNGLTVFFQWVFCCWGKNFQQKHKIFKFLCLSVDLPMDISERMGYNLFIAFHLGFCLAGPTKCPFKDRRLYGYKEFFFSESHGLSHPFLVLLAVLGHKLNHSRAQQLPVLAFLW